jgi:chromosome segregation ATPase
MNAVRNESAQLAAAKDRIAELEEMNKSVNGLQAMLSHETERSSTLQRQLAETEFLANQMRADMQRLNDIYGKERKYRAESEQQRLRMSNDMDILNKSVVLLQAENSAARESLESVKIQLEESKYERNLEKAEYNNTVKALRNQLEESESAKKDISLHFWNIKEDTKKLQEVLSALQAENALLRQESGAVLFSVSRQRDRELMVSEDYRSAMIRLQHRAGDSRQAVMSLQGEVKQLYAALQIQESTAAKAIEAANNAAVQAQSDLAKSEAATQSLQLSLSEQSSAVQALQDEVADLKARHGSVGKLEAAVSSLELENSRLKSSLAAKESSLLVAEQSLKDLMAQRELEISNFSSNAALVDALQAELREVQDQRWQESSKVREESQKLQAELKASRQERDDAQTRAESLATEKLRYEDFLKKEIQNASHLGSVLKDELERRLNELGQTMKDRDHWRGQCEQLSSKVTELTESIARNDVQFRQILEADRAKVQQDLKSKTNRCKSLEAEKQELLAEASALMKQVQHSQLEKESALRQAEDANRRLTETRRESEGLKVRVADLTEELKSAERKDREMTELLSSKENSYREDIAKLDSVIKSSKKTAASQVSEMSEKLRVIMAACEEQRLRIASLEASERKALNDVDRRAEDVKTLTDRHEASQQQLTAELLTLRRDISEGRARLKLAQEECVRRERETVAVQMECTKLEAEISRQRDRIHDAEERCVM